jgi:hypothetical protein
MQEDNMNEPQKQTIEILKKILPKAHFINIRVRINGEWREYEADFLKELIENFNAEELS